MGFILGRQILDSYFLANEVLHSCDKGHQSCYMLKIDFEKAFDTVKWSHLQWVMEQLGFGVKWRFWISECLFGSRASILLNGSPTSDFMLHNGVKQGCSLSPLLFIIAVEPLSLLVQKMHSQGFIHGFQFNDVGLVLSHLQFADDTVFFVKADNFSVLNL